MIRRICNVKPADVASVRSNKLLAQLGCCGNVKCARDKNIEGKRGPGRPKMTWRELTERDRSVWNLSTVDPLDRDSCRSGVRSAMRAASQLSGREPTA